MAFPSHIAQILDEYGVPADTKAALYDLYIGLGDHVLDVFSDIAASVASPAFLRPEDTLSIREQVVERFLVRNHPRWLEGKPTPSLWHPRALEGRASGLALPLGDVSEAAHAIVGEGQPVPDGVVVLGRNAHSGGREETASFDVIPASLDDAIAIGKSAGRQHTLPGSVGETSGTLDSIRGVALIWEIQPNVYKPAGDRNRAIAKVYRRHRNWHLVTLAAALEWLRAHAASVFVLRGAALAPTHEADPQNPISNSIVSMHDRTVARVAHGLGLTLEEASADDEFLLLESYVMNHALRKHVLQNGAAEAMWRIR